MKVTDAITKFLATHGVEFCFELVGGMITHLLDSMAADGRVQIISSHHEQAAAFSAEGVGRQTLGRKLAVAMGTSGPGATNLITGIGSCWLDSVPCLFITGQVNTHELKDGLNIRQQGFQELDIVSLVGTITKSAVQITDRLRVLPELHRALGLALSGRQGPVLVDLPNDIQRQDIPDEEVRRWMAMPLVVQAERVLTDAEIGQVMALCRSASRPLVCVGGGARWASELIGWLAELATAGVPYVTTLMGHEQVNVDPYYFNMIGAYGNREANWAIQNCDLLIVLGARMDVRQTGADIQDFARHAKIIQIDIDAAQLNNQVKVDVALCVGASNFCRQFRPRTGVFLSIDDQWVPRLLRMRDRSDIDEYADWKISPHGIFRRLNEVFRGTAVEYVCDVGNHQMWAAHGLRVGEGQAVHYSGGMGAMGFALPAAIGVALSSRKMVVVITGDGSLQINIQELDTLRRLGLRIIIIVMNNFALGMVKNFQDMYFDGRDQSTRKGYSCPSFVKVAAAYGIDAIPVSDMNELNVALADAVHRSGPLLIEVLMEGANECRPRLSFGKKLDEQYPAMNLG